MLIAGKSGFDFEFNQRFPLLKLHTHKEKIMAIIRKAYCNVLSEAITITATSMLADANMRNPISECRKRKSM